MYEKLVVCVCVKGGGEESINPRFSLSFMSLGHKVFKLIVMKAFKVGGK